MKQPWGIILNCIVLGLGAVACLLGIVALSIVGSFVEDMPIVGIFAGIIAFILLVMAIVYFALCYGLWVHNKIAWWVLVILNGLSVVSSFFSLFNGSGFISLAIVIILFAGLLHEDTITAVDPGISYTGWTLKEK